MFNNTFQINCSKYICYTCLCHIYHLLCDLLFHLLNVSVQFTIDFLLYILIFLIWSKYNYIQNDFTLFNEHIKGIIPFIFMGKTRLHKPGICYKCILVLKSWMIYLIFLILIYTLVMVMIIYLTHRLIYGGINKQVEFQVMVL